MYIIELFYNVNKTQIDFNNIFYEKVLMIVDASINDFIEMIFQNIT